LEAKETQGEFAQLRVGWDDMAKIPYFLNLHEKTIIA